jgi:hypothetical protein
MMKKIVLVLAGLAVASIASAANAPAGMTGLWRFQSNANKLTATLGTDLVTSDPANSGWMTGPWTDMGWDGTPTSLSDNGVVQERSWDYLTVYHGIGANGGGSYVNEYTVAIDYIQTSDGNGGYNSLFQTSWSGTANDGDLWMYGTSRASSTIGSGDLGYSTSTFDASTWHRIVWSVDNGSFFRVYVDGTLYLDAAGQSVDGRYALELDRFHLFADNSWEDAWGMIGTAAVWGRALTTDEVAGMGGWIGGSATPTALTIPEPSSLSFLALGGLLMLVRRVRK